MTSGVCLHGRPLLEPCEACRAFVAGYVARFRADLAAGKHDAAGYTVEERGASERRRQLLLF